MPRGRDAGDGGHSLGTLLALGIVLLIANATSAITSVYWTEAPLSLWGELVIMVLYLGVASALLLAGVARAHGVPLGVAFAIDDDPAQRSLCARHRGRMTVGQTMFACSAVNAFAAVTSWYPTPPDRTPPIIQSLFNSLLVIAAAPASKLLLGDTKVYCARAPMGAAALLLLAAVVSLLPELTAPGGAAAQFQGSGAGAWSVYYALAMVPNAAAIVCGQLFQIRAGALAPGASAAAKRLIIARMLLYNQLYVLGWLCAGWWVDVLPWFGSSASAAEWAAGLLRTAQCSLGGPGAVSAGGAAAAACPRLTPLWMALYTGSYIVLLVAQAAISAESAVFNTAVLLLSGCAVSLFFLLPGVNPDAADTPAWSVLAALGLSALGVVLWKRWELQTPPHAQFSVRSLAEELAEEEEEERQGKGKGQGAGAEGGKGRRGWLEAQAEEAGPAPGGEELGARLLPER